MSIKYILQALARRRSRRIAWRWLWSLLIKTLAATGVTAVAEEIALLRIDYVVTLMALNGTCCTTTTILH